MESKIKYVPYDKMSKKAQKEFNQKKRIGWGELSPATRIVQNKKAYNRQASKLEARGAF